MALVETVTQLLGDVAHAGVNVDLLDIQSCPPPHDLHRLRQPLPQHRRAQHVVPRDHRLHGIDKCVQTHAIVETERNVG